MGENNITSEADVMNKIVKNKALPESVPLMSEVSGQSFRKQQNLLYQSGFDRKF